MNISFSMLKDIIRNKDWEALNQFLVKLGQDPENKHLKFLDYIADHLKETEFSQIEINYFFALGEVGAKFDLKDSHISLILERYYKVDRWIRNEIINTLDGILDQWELKGSFIELFKNALLDSYTPLQQNALQVIKKKAPLPDILLSILIFLLNNAEGSFLDSIEIILKNNISNKDKLFKMINEYEIASRLKPTGIRSLLSIYFRSVYQLEEFRNLIEKSEWSETNKDKFLKETDTFERILLTQL